MSIHVGRRRGGRPRRRSTTIKLQDKATFRGMEHSVYSRKGGPADRVIFPKDAAFRSQRVPIGSKHKVRYLGRTYTARKSIRLVGSRLIPVLEFEVA